MMLVCLGYSQNNQIIREAVAKLCVYVCVCVCVFMCAC